MGFSIWLELADKGRWEWELSDLQISECKKSIDSYFVCVLSLIFCFYLFSGIRGSLVADSAAKDALGGDVQMNS